MKKILVLFLCFTICLAGCGGAKKEETKGVYYKKIDETVVGIKYSPTSCVLYSSLYYDSKIYTSGGTTMHLVSENKEDLNLDKVLGKEIGTVYGNYSTAWSADRARLKQVTYEGKLFEIKGFDSEFSTGIYYETTIGDTKYYELKIFEHLNDIYLDKGIDLYTYRYDIETTKEVDIYGEDATYINTLSCSDERIEVLIERAKEATFIAEENENCPELSKYDARLVFKYDNGVCIEVFIYFSGYMTVEKYGEKYILYVGEDTCKNILE